MIDFKYNMTEFKCFKVLLTLQIFNLLFSLDYDFRISIISRNFIWKLFFLKDSREKCILNLH